ncbi:MAG: hypothetical protein JW909_09010 [Planctomycetes bacterium]|nr:hypothetical protein [Planctomycetota bacterium]
MPPRNTVLPALAALLYAASLVSAEQTRPPDTSGPDYATTGTPTGKSPSSFAPGWNITYVPLAVTEGEVVTLVARRKSGSLPPEFSLSSRHKDDRSPAPALLVDKRAEDEVALRFTPSGTGAYVVSGSGLAAAVRLTDSLSDLNGAVPRFNQIVNPRGGYFILYHSRRVVRESRKWYLVKKTLRKILPDELPGETLILLPGGTDDMKDFRTTLKNSDLPGRKIIMVPASGISPYLAFLTGLAARSGDLAAAERSVILLLPPGEWDGGLAPDEYRRSVEWLLDRFADAGTTRMVVAGPVGTGVAPKRAAQYRSAASGAAESRKAAYLQTEDLVRREDLCASEHGPITNTLQPAAQVRLAHEIINALKSSPVIPGSGD